MRYVDARKREDEILDLIVDSYIKEFHPVSSSYLCQKHNLPYSSATIRNVMGALEKQGFLTHVYTSSGRVPTKSAFKRYVEHINKKDIINDDDLPELANIDRASDVQEVFNVALEVLSNISGYTSLIGMQGFEDRLLFRGARFILDQPEFEDIEKLRDLFYALEVKIDQLQQLLLGYVDDDLHILVGDDIGFDEISDCSLLVSGLRENDCSIALALLGPMRMDYERACTSLYSVKSGLEDILRNFL